MSAAPWGGLFPFAPVGIVGHMERNSGIKDTDRTGGGEPSLRVCEAVGCEREGAYRAPRAPGNLRSYRWFCLDHVRDYNRAWNFFSGWSRTDIEKFQRDDITGHRPTWPIGCDPGARRREDLEAMLGAFQREWLEDEACRRSGEGPEQVPAAHREALAVLDLAPHFTLGELKRRYKALVKRHHPDANGGSRDSEELLKRINRAYNDLRNAYS